MGHLILDMMGAKIGDRSQVELGEILNFGNLVQLQLVIVVINIGLKMHGSQFYFASEIN